MITVDRWGETNGPSFFFHHYLTHANTAREDNADPGILPQNQWSEWYIGYTDRASSVGEKKKRVNLLKHLNGAQDGSNVKLVLYSVCFCFWDLFELWGFQKMFCTGIFNFIQLKQVTWNWVVRIRPCCIVNLSLISTALSFIHTHLGTQRSPYNSENTCFINLQSFSLHFLSC